jgi:hypothetical protein
LNQKDRRSCSGSVDRSLANGQTGYGSADRSTGLQHRLVSTSLDDWT